MKNNLRRLGQILESYSDEEIKAARRYKRTEDILIDRFIGMIRGYTQTDNNGSRYVTGKYSFLSDFQQRDLAKTVISWLMGRDLINVDKVDQNYTITHRNVGMPQPNFLEEDDEELNK